MRQPHTPRTARAGRQTASGGPAGSSWPSRAWRRPCWPAPATRPSRCHGPPTTPSSSRGSTPPRPPAAAPRCRPSSPPPRRPAPRTRRPPDSPTTPSSPTSRPASTRRAARRQAADPKATAPGTGAAAWRRIRLPSAAQGDPGHLLQSCGRPFSVSPGHLGWRPGIDRSGQPAAVSGQEGRRW